MKRKWMGYKHKSGTLHTKPLFCCSISEANSSPFVEIAFDLGECENKEEAELKLKKKLKGGERDERRELLGGNKKSQ